MSAEATKHLLPEYSITDKLYFGEFAIYKKTISAFFKHPLLNKVVHHQFHIGTLEQHKNADKFNKRVKEFGFKIDKSDRTEELKLFNVKPEDGSIYLFFEIWSGKKRLPLHYTAYYTRDCYEDDSEKDPMWSKYLHACDELISGYIYEEDIHPSCVKNLFYFFHEFGFDLYEYFNKNDPDYEETFIDPEWLTIYERKFKRIKATVMRNYAFAVLNSVYELAFKEKTVMICEYCGRFIDYHKGKKYCSQKAEKRDCAKKARNRRYYDQRGRHRLDVYNRKTKELRKCYRDHNIKK